MVKKVIHLPYPLSLWLLSNIKNRLPVQSSVTASEKLTVNSINFTVITKKVLFHYYACNFSGTTTADLHSAKILYPNFLQQTTLCTKKKSIWEIFSPQFPFHLLNLYLVYNQLQISLRENIPRGAGFPGKSKKLPNNNTYISCYCQTDMWQSQSCISESVTTLVKALYQGLFPSGVHQL